jgi:enoyl-CoA hydratase/carnithine racemase
MTIHDRTDDGVLELVMDNPPVNALNIADTYRLADLLDGYRRDAARSAP